VNWIRWDTSTPQSDVVGWLADRLKLPLAHALGHYAAACCGFGMHRADGRVGEVSDELLEQWAMWRGKPGRFAAAFRERCVDESGNLRGWWRNEGVLREQERSRRKPVRPNGLPENPRGESRQIPAGILRGTPTNPRGDSPGNPDKSPRGFSGEPRQIPAGILRVYGT